MNDVLEALRQRRESNAFAAYNHMEIESAERDRVVYRLDIVPESKNPSGFVHGGAFCAMADNAAGAAAHTDGRRYVTQASTMNYIANQTEGTIYATGTVLHRGRATCVARAEITNAEGKLLCTGDFTFFCLDSRA